MQRVMMQLTEAYNVKNMGQKNSGERWRRGVGVVGGGGRQWTRASPATEAQASARDGGLGRRRGGRRWRWRARAAAGNGGDRRTAVGSAMASAIGGGDGRRPRREEAAIPRGRRAEGDQAAGACGGPHGLGGGATYGRHMARREWAGAAAQFVRPAADASGAVRTCPARRKRED